MIPIAQKQFADFKPEFNNTANKSKDSENIATSGFNSEFMSLFQSSLVQSQNHTYTQNDNQTYQYFDSTSEYEESKGTDFKPVNEFETEKTDENLSKSEDEKITDKKETQDTLTENKVSGKKSTEKQDKTESKQGSQKEALQDKNSDHIKTSETKQGKETIFAKEKFEKFQDHKTEIKTDIQKQASLVVGSSIAASSNPVNKANSKELTAIKNKKKETFESSFDKSIKKSSEQLIAKSKNKNIKGHTENPEVRALRVSEDIVSRETMSINSENKNSNQKTTNLHFKFSTPEKPQLSASLKSDMNSDLSSNQNQSGFSMQHSDKLNLMHKLDENPVIRQNMQQQIDQLLQRAKVIIRDSGNAKMSARLNPKELGEINISLVLTDGKLKGRFTVDNSTVQKELHDKLDKLFNEMENEGYVIDGFQIDVKSDTAQSNDSKNQFLESVVNEFHNGNGNKSSVGIREYSSDDYSNTRSIYA